MLNLAGPGGVEVEGGGSPPPGSERGGAGQPLPFALHQVGRGRVAVVPFLRQVGRARESSCKDLVS